MLVLSNDLVLSKSILIFNGTHFPFCTRFPGTFFQKLENVSRCWSKVVYIIGIVFQKSYCRFERMDLCSKFPKTELGISSQKEKKSRKFAYLRPSYDFTNFKLEILNESWRFFWFLKIQNFLKFSENVN